MNTIAGNDRLVKEIDALTYNSRSILNAMINSTVAAGSSSGFSITRAGKDITLNRVDIYRLYKFYQDWQDNGFSNTDTITTSTSKALKSFNTLRLQHDATPVKDELGNITDGSATTSALAKHGKMIYLNSDNVNEFDLPDVNWAAKISVAANPKLITNSAPIPINLRTPIFDPNMSTTKYNNTPTYLFPASYYMMDILGYEGDKIAHYLGGDSWTIQGTDHVELDSKHIILGETVLGSKYKTRTRRGQGDYALIWGSDTVALGAYSTAGGLHSIASNDSSIAIGNRAYSSANNASIVGGLNNSAPGDTSGIYAGSDNVTHAPFSGIFSGVNNSTGSPWFHFIVGAVQSTGCISSCYDACSDSSISSNVNIPGYELAVVDVNIDDIDMKVGDEVLLYNFITLDGTGNSFDGINGNGFSAMRRTVASVQANLDYITSKTTITLKGSATPASYAIGGRISKIKIAGTSSDLGYASSVTGYNNISGGFAQFVVGRFNKYKGVTSIDTRDASNALFIVGAGDTSTRSNSFEVYADGFSAYSRMNPTLGEMYGIRLDSSGTSLMHANNAMFVNGSGAFLLTKKDDRSAGVDVVCGFGGIADYRVVCHSVGITGITSGANANLLSSNTLNNGTYVIGDNVYIIADTLDSTSHILTKISSADIQLTSSKNTVLSFGKLILNGDTYGTLSTNSVGRSFSSTPYTDSRLISQVAFHESSISNYSAAYLPDNGHLGLPNSGGKVHLMTIAGNAFDSHGQSYVNTMQLAWGQYDDNMPWTGNLSIRKSRVTTTAVNGVPPEVVSTEWEALATLTEVNESETRSNGTTLKLEKKDMSVYAYHDGNASFVPVSGYTINRFNITKLGHLTMLDVYITVSANCMSAVITPVPGAITSTAAAIDTILVTFNPGMLPTDYLPNSKQYYGKPGSGVFSFIPKYKMVCGLYTDETDISLLQYGLATIPAIIPTSGTILFRQDGGITFNNSHSFELGFSIIYKNKNF